MSTDYSSYATTTTTFSSAKRTKWETELVKKATGKLMADRWANTKVLGMGEAGTIRLNKILRLSKKTTQDTEGTAYGLADAKSMTTNHIDVTPMEFGDSFLFTDDSDIETMITDPQKQDEIANQLARSLDYQVIKVLSTKGLRHRIDKDASYQVTGTADSGTTATLVDNALTQADDYWNGGYVTIVNPEGPGYDQCVPVTDFTASSDTVACAFTAAPTTSSKYRMTVGTGILATDVITATGLMDVMALHSILQTDAFAGGTFRGFIDAEQERDFFNDTTMFTNPGIYSDPGRFANYRVLRFMGIELMVSSELYREDVDGTENQDDGIVHVSPIFGANAYSVVRWGMGSGKFGVKFLYKDKPDSTDLRDKLRAISWKAKFAAYVQRATSVVDLMTGATSLNILTM